MKYKPRDKDNPREYTKFTVRGMGWVAQLSSVDGKPSVKAVYKEMDKSIIECVSGDRKVYKYMKKKYYNINHEESLHELPSGAEIEKLQQTIKSSMKEDETKEITHD